MSKHKIIIAVGAGTLAVVAAAWFLQFEGSTGALIERFPNVPPDVVRKVHKEMVREALGGDTKYNKLSETDLDALFLAKAKKYL